MKFGWIIFLFYWGSVCGGFGAKYAGESFGLDNIVGRIFFWGGSRSIFRIEEKLHKNCTKTNRNYTNMLVVVGV